MRDRPSGAALTQLALGSESDQSLVRLARDIAAREAAAGAAPLIAERDHLVRLYGETMDAAEPLAQALMRLNGKFARDLRAGLFDRPGRQRDAALQILRRSANARLAETNPDYVEDT